MPKNKGWFRLYDRMIDSPQVLELNDSEFRLLISLWCLASSENSHGLVPYSDAAIRRRVMPEKSLEEIRQMLAHLKALDLLAGEEGKYEIPRWDIHQYGYPSRVPENRSDLNKEKKRKASGEGTESERKENGKSSESERKENGKVDPDPDPDIYIPPINNSAREFEKLVARPLSSMEAEFFQEAEQVHGPELVQEALAVAFRRKQRPGIGYIRAILESWAREGFTTVDQVRAADSRPDHPENVKKKGVTAHGRADPVAGGDKYAIPADFYWHDEGS